MAGDEPVAMLASSLTSVSLDPPLLLVCVMDGSRSWARLLAVQRLGISVLGGGQIELCQLLASRSEQRLAGVDITVTPQGAVLLPGATAWFDCSIHDLMRAGDHTIVLLRIEALHARPDERPLVFHASAYHRLTA